MLFLPWIIAATLFLMVVFFMVLLDKKQWELTDAQTEIYHLKVTLGKLEVLLLNQEKQEEKLSNED